MTFTSSGGALLISLGMYALSTAPNHVTCQPVIDGQWAGAYGNLPNPGDPYWKEGLIGVDSTYWRDWTKTRLYPNIPAGPHTIKVQCANNGNTTYVGDPSIGSSMYVVEVF